MSHSISFRVVLSTVVALGLSSTAFAGSFSIAPGTSGTQLQSLSSGGDKGKTQGQCDPVECNSQIVLNIESASLISHGSGNTQKGCPPIECNSQLTEEIR